MAEKRHKCIACGKTRQERYMVAEQIKETKKGRQIIIYQCGNCEEENRGK